MRTPEKRRSSSSRQPDRTGPDRPRQRGGLGSVDTDAFLKPMPQGEIAGLPRYGDGLVIARDPAALWTPLSQRGALDLVVKARQLEVRVRGERRRPTRLDWPSSAIPRSARSA